MCFKGTEKVQKTHNLLKQYNEIGASFNAYTEKKFTVITVKCDNAHFDKCLHLLEDMSLHSIFSKHDYEKEKHVVIEENIRNEDNSEYFLEKRMNAIFYGGSSYQYPVDDRSYHHPYIKYDDLYEWYRTFFHPANMCLSVVSNLSFVDIIHTIVKTDFIKHTQIVKTRFSHLQPVLKLYPINPSSGKLRYLFLNKKNIFTDVIAIGFRTCSRYSLDKYVLEILSRILNGFSGKLFTLLRSERGLTYHSSTTEEYISHTGYFTIVTKTDPKKLIYGAEPGLRSPGVIRSPGVTHTIKRDGMIEPGLRSPGVIPTLINLLIDLKKNGVSQADINLAKGAIKGGLLLSMESIDVLTQYNGNEIISSDYDKIVPYQKLWDTYFSKITKKDVDRVIRKYFSRENMIIGIVHGGDLDRTIIENICERFI
jgi:predicted Zn-dependent peptidase